MRQWTNDGWIDEAGRVDEAGERKVGWGAVGWEGRGGGGCGDCDGDGDEDEGVGWGQEGSPGRWEVVRGSPQSWLESDLLYLLVVL